MNVITLDNTLPRVFAGREAIPSDVWQCPLSLHRGTVYLVTAESGSGKSSLCAYLYGYRKDYSGTIAFDGRYIDSLSVGALIRTACQPCYFFLLDEPVSHLDEVNNGIVAQIISDEALKSGAAVIATSVGNNLNIKVGEVLKL